MSNDSVLPILLENDFVLANHAADLEDPIRLLNEHLALRADEHFPSLVVLLVKHLIFIESHRLEFFQVVEVKGVASILQELHVLDCLLVQEA